MIERGRSGRSCERRLVCDAAPVGGPPGGRPCRPRTKPAASSTEEGERVGSAAAAGATDATGAVVAAGGVPALGVVDGGCEGSGGGTDGGTDGGPGRTGGGPGSIGAIVCTTCWIVCETCVTTVVAVTVFDWITSPSSPGLKIRIDVATLHIPHAASGVVGAAGASGASQLHCQFQIHVPAAAAAGSTAGSGSLQFHVQFQIHVVGGAAGRSGVLSADDVAVVGGITGVELVLPEFPF